MAAFEAKLDDAGFADRLEGLPKGSPRCPGGKLALLLPLALTLAASARSALTEKACTK
jgi:hypothetical protein